MLMPGDQYRESIRDDREVWINGERVDDVPSHPAFKPIVDVRARIYDMAHEDRFRDAMAYRDGANEWNTTAYKLPYTQDDWHAKRRWIDTVMKEIGGVVIRVGDETVGEMWSLWDGKDVVNEIDPRFGENIERHIVDAGYTPRRRNMQFDLLEMPQPAGARS